MGVSSCPETLTTAPILVVGAVVVVVSRFVLIETVSIGSVSVTPHCSDRGCVRCVSPPLCFSVTPPFRPLRPLLIETVSVSVLILKGSVMRVDEIVESFVAGFAASADLPAIVLEYALREESAALRCLAADAARPSGRVGVLMGERALFHAEQACDYLAAAIRLEAR